MPPQQNTSPILNGDQMPPPHEPQKHSIGPIAGAVIVILLLIAGGLYFWGAQLNNQQNPPPYIPSQDTSADEGATVTSDTSAGLPPQNESDDVSSIEADANAMSMDQLNASNQSDVNGL